MKRVPLNISPPNRPKVPRSTRVSDGITGDSLQNIVTGLGTSKDQTTGTRFVFNLMNKQQLEAAYRSDWIARKIIDIPAQDSTREWRTWQADKKDSSLVEDLEKDLRVAQKVKAAMIKARLYGGASLLLGTDDSVTMDKPLEPEKIGKDGLKFVHVVSRWELQGGEIDWDVTSETYGQPKYYQRVQQGADHIHPSRVVRFVGHEVPDITLTDGWGDSILQGVTDAVIAAGTTAANGAQLLNELKMDVIKIPELGESLSNKAYASRLLERFSLANATKGMYNILLLDKEEEWERITANLSGLPDTLKMYLLIASAAADIPATRMLGQSPAGLSATGESDLRNYYDHVKSEQMTTQQPAMAILDELLIRSALGTKNPEDVEYVWNPLWQLDWNQKSTVIGQKASSFKIDVDAGLIPGEILRDARIAQLIEDDVYPGLEQIVDDYGPLDPIEEMTPGAVIGPDGAPIEPTDPKHPNNQQPQIDPATGKPKELAPPKAPSANPFDSMTKRVKRADMKSKKYRSMDGVTRTLYVYRRVLNSQDIMKWAKGKIPSLVPANELHVTVMYSRTPVDWSKTGEAWASDKDGNITVVPGGMRALQKFGNAIVLCFNSSDLAWRHMQIKENCGATYDFPEYQPHVTLAYLGSGDAPVSERDLADLGAYNGEIKFGPEVYEEADGNPMQKDERGRPFFDFNENHDPDGKFGTGSGGGGGGSKVAGAKAAIKNLTTKAGAKEAVKAAVGKVNQNKLALINGAVQGSLYHVAGIDYGPDIEKLIGHEIEHFAQNAKIGLSMAKDTMAKAGNALLSHFQKLRSSIKDGHLALDADEMTKEELDHAIAALKDFLKAVDAYEVPENDPAEATDA